jgi:hypothetical protein
MQQRQESQPPMQGDAVATGSGLRYDRHDGTGHQVNRFLLGQPVGHAKGPPGPERDGVADDGADEAKLVWRAVEWRGEQVTKEASSAKWQT